MKARMKRRCVHSKIKRVREWLFWMSSRYAQVCHFCGKAIDPNDFIAGDTSDGILLHHINHNRGDNRAANLVPAHRPCHRLHHIAINKKTKKGRYAK